MRKTLLTGVAVIGLASGAALAQTSSPTPSQTTPPDTMSPPAETTVPAHHNHSMRAGHEPGAGDSEPSSTRASNITGGHSEIAPRLPTPSGGDNAGVQTYLRDAQNALNHHRTGEAQEALERAQTRLLDRSVAQGDTSSPAQDPMVQTVEQARQALAHNDIKSAQRLINDAVTQTAANGQTGGAGDGSGMSDRGMTGSGAGMDRGAAASGRMTGPTGPGMTAPRQTNVPPASGAAPGTVNPSGGATSQY